MVHCTQKMNIYIPLLPSYILVTIIYDNKLPVFMHTTILQMCIVSASKGKCHCELKVSDDHVNSKGTLHGGMAATLIDAVSAMAVATTKTVPGFTTDLNIT